MQIYNLEIDGQILEVVRDSDGKFIIPDHLRPMNTALKPAFEPIVLARKPLSEGTVAANVLRWRTGALNIDACRIEAVAGDAPVSWEAPRGGMAPLPLMAIFSISSIPVAMRGAQAALSPSFGALATPLAWHTTQVLS